MITLFIILLTKTTLFNLKQVNVEGNNIISNEKIELASGINLGENIFKINTERIESNLLNHPYIENAKVSRKLPNKIKISINERKEVVSIINKGSYIYIDNNGYILSIVTKRKNNEVPLVKGIDNDMLNIGSKIDLNNHVELNQILSLVNMYNKNEYIYKLDSIKLNPDNNVLLNIDTGTKVAFGVVNDVKYKLRLLNEILKDAKNKDIKPKVINLNKGTNPIIEK